MEEGLAAAVLAEAGDQAGKLFDGEIEVLMSCAFPKT